MKKKFFFILILLTICVPFFAHNENKMTVQVKKSNLIEIWLADEPDYEKKLETLHKAIEQKKLENFPVHELEEQNRQILNNLLIETSPQKIYDLLLQYQELETTAAVYSRRKFSQLNVALILIVCIFITITIWLAISSNSSKHKAQQEARINNLIISTQEMERKRISQELHDTVTQDIRTSLLFIHELKDSLHSISEESEQTFTKLEKLENENLKNIRSIIQNLVSPEIESADFKELIFHHCNMISETSKIQCTFFSPAETDFSTLTTIQKLNIFRIIQEAITNAVKHSKASEISVIARKDSKLHKLIFFISDDGIGIENTKQKIPENESNSHFGMQNMKYRANVLNAQLFITSSQEMGTEIKLIVPLPDKTQ